MSTRVSALNSTNANWNDFDIQPFHRDHVGELGEGVVDIDKVLASLENGGFELATGTISADGWIGSINYGWYADLNGATASVAFANDFAQSGNNSLKINCTVNDGSQSVQARPCANGSIFGNADKYKMLPIKAGEQYELSAYIKTDSISSGNGGGASLRYLTIDEDGNVIDAEAGTTYVTGTNAFAQVTANLTPSTGAKYLLIFCAVDDETGTAWFDDLQVKEIGSHLKVEEEAIPTNTVKVNVGIGYIKINKNSTDYLVRFECDVAESVAIPANISGNPRIDLIVAKVDTATDADATASNIGTLEVVEGTPDASPVAPSIPANSIVLAQVTVANGQTVFQTAHITDAREPIRIQYLSVDKFGSDTDIPNLMVVRKPATASSRGAVKLSAEPTDPDNPVAVENSDPRLLTSDQKTQLIASLSGGNSITMPAGENIDVSAQPKLGYLDDTNGKILVLDGEVELEVSKYFGHITSSGDGDTDLDGFDAGDDNEYYAGASPTNHATANTTPATLKSAFSNANSSALASSNDTDQSSTTGTNTEYAYQLLEFDISIAGFSTSTIHLIELLIEASAGGTTLTDGWDAYVWDNDGSQWVLACSSDVAYSTDESVTNKTLMLTAEEVAKYLDGSQLLNVLIKTKGTSDGSNTLNLDTDYAKVNVSQGVIVQQGGVVNGYNNLEAGKWYHPAISGSHGSKTIMVNSNQTGTEPLGYSGSYVAKGAPIGTDSYWAGWLGQFTIRLSKTNAGQDVYGYIVQLQDGASTISGGSQLPTGGKVIHEFYIATASISSSMGDHLITVNKYLPKGKYYLVLSTATQSVDASNYINVQYSNVGGGNGTLFNGSSWNGVGATRQIYMVATEGVDYISDPDRITGDIARTNCANSHLVVGRAISETQVLVTKPPRMHYQHDSNISSSQFYGKTNYAIDGTAVTQENFEEIVTEFKPRTVRVLAHMQDSSASDQQTVVAEMWFHIDKKGNTWSTVYSNNLAVNQNFPNFGSDLAGVWPNYFSVLFLDESFVLNYQPQTANNTNWYANVYSIEAWS